MSTSVAPKKTPPKHLPRWKVLLHNDNKNEATYIVETLVELTPLKKEEAVEKTVEAHKTGVALIIVTHKERAELYLEQFQTKKITITIEPEE
jgi:ATP-dependent Clp protease adaptor protein ClpS